jgi:hypothetical protein
VSGWLRRHRAWLRRLPAIVAALALLILVARNADTPALPSYDAPEGFTAAPPPTTAPRGGARPVLAAVDGTTTTAVPPNVGRARIAGFVSGPDGAVAGATVRLERVVGGATQVLDVVTTPEGRYDAGGIGGGRYRVRAFLAPTFAMAEGEVFFLPDGEERTLDLRVERFADPSVAVAVAPDPPVLDQPLNLAVRVTGRVVDVDGVVRSQPVGGATVQVTVFGGWSPSPTTATTDGEGQARFTATCRSTAPTQVQVSVRLPGAAPPTTTPGSPPGPSPTPTTAPAPATGTFDVPSCVDPATLTTTTTTTTAGDPGPTSSSSSTPPTTAASG